MLEPKEIIAKTVEHVRPQMLGESSGHDWEHVKRVWLMAIDLAKKEGGDRLVIELAALLHDIADWKFHDGDDEAGPRAATEWLSSLGVGEDIIDHVCDIIRTISFRGAKVATPMKSIEGQIVQDADRLDAIGAVGIARVFAYGGNKKRAIFDSEKKPELHATASAYKTNNSPSITHFFEKLLFLKDRMNTNAAKPIAEERHEFMLSFLKQYFKESYESLSQFIEDYTELYPGLFSTDAPQPQDDAVVGSSVGLIIT